MEVVTSCPMQVMGFVWPSGADTFAQTIVVKATFVLEPGHAKIATESAREPVHDLDRFVNAGVLFAPTDHVPYKPRVDVMLVGHAYAPEKQPVRSLVTKLAVGDWSKSIEVFCDRGFRAPDERLLEGPRFTKMALDWTRAAGGLGTTNPVGVCVIAASGPLALGIGTKIAAGDPHPSTYNLVSLPNLQPPKTLVTKGSDTIAPVGYGPVAATWPGRTKHLEATSGLSAPLQWDVQPLPANFNFEYFQAAPRDQQLAQLRPDEELVLENLHPVHARLVTQLPGVCPRAIVHRASGEREDVALVADTLWIDVDRSICCVVWRGSIGLRYPTEAGFVAVTLVEPPVESVDENLIVTIPPGVVAEEELASMTMVPPFGTKPKGSAIPFVFANIAERAANPVRSQDDGALPFGPSGLSGTPPPPIALGQITLPAQSPTSSPTVPDFKVSEPAASHLALVPGAQHRSVPSASATTPCLCTQQSPHDVATTPETTGSPAVDRMLQLLWYDVETIERLRCAPAWKKLFNNLDVASRLAGADERTLEVFTVLANAIRIDMRKGGAELDHVVATNGRFVSPLVLLTGELEFPFNELEMLRLAVSTAQAEVTSADERLKEALQGAEKFLSTPGLLATPASCERLTTRIRDAFVKEKKALPRDYLNTQIERGCIWGRYYQTYEVFGGAHVRCWVWQRGETTPLLGYLPADVPKKLPMLKRLPVRVMAEVHPAQDPHETSTTALRLVAVGRMSGNRSYV